MKTNSNFTIAVHTMVAIAYFSPKNKVTSDFIAVSVGVNPVVIRRTLSDLKKAGFVKVKAGQGGATLAKKTNEITLLDIYKAVIKDEGSVFSFHENPNSACPVGKKIHKILDVHLDAAQSAFEKKIEKCNDSGIVKELLINSSFCHSEVSLVLNMSYTKSNDFVCT